MNSEPNRKGGARLPKGDKPPKGTKKPRTPRTKQQKVLHVLFIIATVLAAIIVVLFIAYKILVVKPPQVERPDRPNLPVSSQVPGASAPPAVSNDNKKDFYTFLIVGKDTGGGGNTDTILLAAYDIPGQKLSVMSIPRDTLVNVSWDMKKINSIYPVYGGGEKGIAALKEEVSQLVGFVPDYEIVVEWEAVGKLVDAIGGVEFDVPRNMNYDDPTQNLHIHIKKGLQNLNGEEAMGVIRYRHDNDMRYGYADGDLGRIKTQQAFLTAVVKQCLQFKNVTKIGELAEIFTTYVDTDLSINNLAYFAEQAIFGGLNMENVNFVTMPWVSASNVYSFDYHNYPSYVAPDVDALVALVNESFNPYKDALDKRELDIMYVNKDGTLGSTTGVLADSKYNSRIKNKGGSSSSGSSGSSGTSSAKPSPSPTPTPAPSVSPDVSQSPAPGISQAPGSSQTPGGSQAPGNSLAPGTSPAPGSSSTPQPSAPAPTEAPPASAQPTPTPAATPAPTPDQGGSEGPPPGITIVGDAA